MGGDASRNGAELFETEADFSAKIVTFRLVGGMHPPHPPPKSAIDDDHKKEKKLSLNEIALFLGFGISSKNRSLSHGLR